MGLTPRLVSHSTPPFRLALRLGLCLYAGHEVAGEVDPYGNGAYHELDTIGEDVLSECFLNAGFHALGERVLQDEIGVEVAVQIGLEVLQVAEADVLPLHIAEVEREDALQ